MRVYNVCMLDLDRRRIQTNFTRIFKCIYIIQLAAFKTGSSLAKSVA
jgi:hypothetical protein